MCGGELMMACRRRDDQPRLLEAAEEADQHHQCARSTWSVHLRPVEESERSSPDPRRHSYGSRARIDSDARRMRWHVHS